MQQDDVHLGYIQRVVIKLSTYGVLDIEINLYSFHHAYKNAITLKCPIFQ